MAYCYDGKTYETIKEMAEEYGIDRQRIYSFRRRGWSLEDAMQMCVNDVRGRGRLFEYNGKLYRSPKALAEEYGLLEDLPRRLGGIHHEPCRAQAGRCGEYPHPCAADRRADPGGGPLLWPRERGCEPHCKVHPDVRVDEERARRRHPGGVLPPLRELHCSDGILPPLRALHGSHHPHLKTEDSEAADRCRSRKTPAAVFLCVNFFALARNDILRVR